MTLTEVCEILTKELHTIGYVSAQIVKLPLHYGHGELDESIVFDDTVVLINDLYCALDDELTLYKFNAGLFKFGLILDDSDDRKIIKKIKFESGAAYPHLDIVEAYFENGVVHRENGPAILFGDGSMLWYKHGNIHREDGPARIYHDGSVLWVYTGIKYDNIKNFAEVAKWTDEQLASNILLYVNT